MLVVGPADCLMDDVQKGLLGLFHGADLRLQMTFSLRLLLLLGGLLLTRGIVILRSR